jgi:hypothetical protein
VSGSSTVPGHLAVTNGSLNVLASSFSVAFSMSLGNAVLDQSASSSVSIGGDFVVSQDSTVKLTAGGSAVPLTLQRCADFQGSLAVTVPPTASGNVTIATYTCLLNQFSDVRINGQTLCQAPWRMTYGTAALFLTPTTPDPACQPSTILPTKRSSYAISTLLPGQSATLPSSTQAPVAPPSDEPVTAIIPGLPLEASIGIIAAIAFVVALAVALTIFFLTPAGRKARVKIQFIIRPTRKASAGTQATSVS